MDKNYMKFGLMMLISFVIMYSVMFLNVYKTSHIYLSTTRAYMAMLMVAPMAVYMLLMMSGMYTKKGTNAMIIISAMLVFFISLILLRNQEPIADKQYMKAMIPHHSSAILTSKNAKLYDPEVKNLAEKIIKSQEEEITQMKGILERMEGQK